MEIYGALSAKPKNSNLRKWPYDPESCHLDSIPGMPFWFQVEKVRQASANPAQVLSLLSLAPFLHFSWFATAKQPSFLYKHTGWRWSGRSWSCRARNSHEELDFEGLTCSCSPMVFFVCCMRFTESFECICEVVLIWSWEEHYPCAIPLPLPFVPGTEFHTLAYKIQRPKLSHQQ